MKNSVRETGGRRNRKGKERKKEKKHEGQDVHVQIGVLTFWGKSPFSLLKIGYIMLWSWNIVCFFNLVPLCFLSLVPVLCAVLSSPLRVLFLFFALSPLYHLFDFVAVSWWSFDFLSCVWVLRFLYFHPIVFLSFFFLFSPCLYYGCLDLLIFLCVVTLMCCLFLKKKNEKNLKKKH